MSELFRNARSLRWFAVVCGVLGALAAVLLPFLPVRYEITTLQWPTTQGTQAVSAPLSAYQPIRLDLNMPCSAAQDLDARSPGPAVLLSTNPPEAEYGNLTGLRLEVADGQLRLISQGQQLGTTALPAGDCAIGVHSDGQSTSADVGGTRFAQVGGDARPQLTGIFSDVDGQVDDTGGMSLSAEVDDRYNSHPTPLKIAAMTVAVLGTAGALFALHRIDALAGRKPVRRARGRWRLTGREDRKSVV